MEIARDWRLRGVRLRLQGEICPGDGKPIFPPRDICPRCSANTIGESGKPLITIELKQGKPQVISSS